MKTSSCFHIALLAILAAGLHGTLRASDPLELPLTEHSPNLHVWGGGEIQQEFQPDGSLKILWQAPDRKRGGANVVYDLAQPFEAAHFSFDLDQSRPEAVFVHLTLADGKILTMRRQGLGEGWQTYTYDLNFYAAEDMINLTPVTKVKIVVSSTQPGSLILQIRNMRLE